MQIVVSEIQLKLVLPGFRQNYVLQVQVYGQFRILIYGGHRHFNPNFGDQRFILQFDDPQFKHVRSAGISHFYLDGESWNRYGEQQRIKIIENPYEALLVCGLLGDDLVANQHCNDTGDWDIFHNLEAGCPITLSFSRSKII